MATAWCVTVHVHGQFVPPREAILHKVVLGRAIVKPRPGPRRICVLVKPKVNRIRESKAAETSRRLPRQIETVPWSSNNISERRKSFEQAFSWAVLLALAPDASHKDPLTYISTVG